MTSCETTLVDISDPEWVPPDEKLRSEIRKAEREGITMEPFEWGRHHEHFLRLMEATERRHGNPPRYPPEFFRRLADLAGRDDRVHWVWCEHEGKPACSHIYILEGGMLQVWQIYFDKAFSFLKPNQYISFAMCRRMAARGIYPTQPGGDAEGCPRAHPLQAPLGRRALRISGLHQGVRSRQTGPVRPVLSRAGSLPGQRGDHEIHDRSLRAPRHDPSRRAHARGHGLRHGTRPRGHGRDRERRRADGLGARAMRAPGRDGERAG